MSLFRQIQEAIAAHESEVEPVPQILLGLRFDGLFARDRTSVQQPC
ncbi:hypothetical protein VZG47_08685 [Synechococcus elongatus IITB5]